MVWGFCYLRIFKKLHSISGRSLQQILRHSRQSSFCQ
jgi:hypothetical protein